MVVAVVMCAVTVGFDRSEGSRELMNQGATKGESGLYQEAIDDFDQALLLDPENGDAYYNRGLARAKDTLSKSD